MVVTPASETSAELEDFVSVEEGDLDGDEVGTIGMQLAELGPDSR
jgi:hypothetical protein